MYEELKQDNKFNKKLYESKIIQGLLDGIAILEDKLGVAENE
jgi:hypothetical protein